VVGEKGRERREREKKWGRDGMEWEIYIESRERGRVKGRKAERVEVAKELMSGMRRMKRIG